LGKLKDSGVPLATGFAVLRRTALLAAIFDVPLAPAHRDRDEIMSV